VVIACIREVDGGAYQCLAGKFRDAGIPCEVFLEPKKLTQQFIQAEKRGARWVLIPGEKPLSSPLTLRELAQRKDREHLSWEEAFVIINENPQGPHGARTTDYRFIWLFFRSFFIKKRRARMFQKRRFFFPLFIGLVMGNLLPAHSVITPQALGDLDAASRRLGSLINQRLAALGHAPPPRIVVGEFLYGEQENSLGIDWRENLVAELSHLPGRGFVLLTGKAEAPEDYRIRGDLIRVGNTIRIYTRLSSVSDSELLSTWNTDLVLTPFITDILEAALPASSGTAPRDPFENDTMDTPAAYTIGSGWMSRTIHVPGDQDFFLLHPEEDGMLSMEISSGLDMVLEFYHGESRSKLDENDDFGGESGDVTIESRIDYPVEGGTPYIVKVRKYTGSDTGAYQFRAAYLEIRDARFEPNDTGEQAGLIELGTPVEAFLSTPSDIDWYRIEVPAPGGLFTVYTEGSVDTLLELYDPQNDLLADADDFAEDTNARIALTLSSGGSYSIKVSAYGSSRGDYTLMTRLREPIGPDPFEDDDALSGAKPIELGETQRRTFTDGDDVDWVSLRIEEPAFYLIIAQGEKTPDLDTYLKLYDEGGQLITEDDDGDEGYSARIRAKLTPGTYFIRLHVLDSGPFDEGYELRVEAE
jgi:hypothetical protein